MQEVNCSHYPSATELANGPSGTMLSSMQHCKSQCLITLFPGAGLTHVQKENKCSEHNDRVREHRIQLLKWGVKKK